MKAKQKLHQKKKALPVKALYFYEGSRRCDVDVNIAGEHFGAIQVDRVEPRAFLTVWGTGALATDVQAVIHEGGAYGKE